MLGNDSWAVADHAGGVLDRRAGVEHIHNKGMPELVGMAFDAKMLEDFIDFISPVVAHGFW